MTARTPVLLVALSALIVLVSVPTAASTGDHPDPGISPSFDLFPQHGEVVAALADHADHPWVTLHRVGESETGAPVQLAVVTDPDSPVPLDQRVVTFIFTQQHGNEPAGTPAALQLLDDITSGGPLAATLDNQVLLLLPMANPDGAAANQRHNADDVDINRDHIGLETLEAQALHRVLNTWDVHVAMDHHEYGGIGLGNPSPVRVYDYDLTTLFPVHGNVRSATDDAARLLMYEGIWPEAEAAGYTANEYGEQTVAGVPVQKLAGGPDPGIMRNHLGLHHIAGLLVETRVDAHPNPFHDAERRTAIHSVVMEATLTYVHENAERFREAKSASLEESVLFPAASYVEGEARGPLAPAYAVGASDEPTLARMIELHGLPERTMRLDDGSLAYTVAHELQGHAAAVLHPASSRATVQGASPLDDGESLAELSRDGTGGPSEDIALPAWSALVAALGAAWLAGVGRGPGRGRR